MAEPQPTGFAFKLINPLDVLFSAVVTAFYKKLLIWIFTMRYLDVQLPNCGGPLVCNQYRLLNIKICPMKSGHY
jgi:hypothetical protein